MFQVDDAERISAQYGAVLADRPSRAARGIRTANTPPFFKAEIAAPRWPSNHKVSVKYMRLLLLSLLFCTSAYADMLSPDEVVSTLVHAAKDDHLTRFLQSADILSIATQPRHALNQESLLALLKGIDPEKIVFLPRDGGSNVKWFPGKDGAVTVRMIEPIRMDFDLSAKKPNDGGEQSFQVIAIHP